MGADVSGKNSPEERALWQRRLAAQANNRAWTLAEKSRRSSEEDDEMLHAAHAAMYFWNIAGEPDNRAHASLLLAHAYALRGQAGSAAQYLEKSWPHLAQPDRAPWERAFAHAVAANVASVTGDAAAHARHYADATAAAEQMTDPQTRELFNATLRVVRVP